ncbi:uncharacterized protein LOC117282444 isoform X3 [Cryptotermes secundus]|uniref:uncharacterized protein LOC117282444 isoform X3 n=1 Tax=Cryptotermes secundus TaxID=105785 RepID=UPI001454C380|nr:uncharacterized protein LOC117282444 isoform X3 [Cryptotermes secundus]
MKIYRVMYIVCVPSKTYEHITVACTTMKQITTTTTTTTKKLTMCDIKAELDSHSDAESTSLISDEENVDRTSTTIPIMKCEAELNVEENSDESDSDSDHFLMSSFSEAQLMEVKNESKEVEPWNFVTVKEEYKEVEEETATEAAVSVGRKFSSLIA